LYGVPAIDKSLYGVPAIDKSLPCLVNDTNYFSLWSAFYCLLLFIYLLFFQAKNVAPD
jgi:hypothetical protein